MCAAWIFVNPTQFGANEDYARYPRDEARDIALLEQERTDLLFMPEAEEIYPEGFDSSVDVGGGGSTTRGHGPARPFPRRGDDSDEVLQYHAAGPGLLWAEGRSADGGDPAAGAGPEPASGGGGLSDCARARWAGDEQPGTPT